ncbi:serine hydrolase domain-containing protein [Brevibacillus reuszeri]|uniref:serine hydrolase domain-containing protein n=1 Tax=Brevibacillus reuszeri TaxID=54915 RepID=UPI00289AFE92|nr:serine hydrolase domain-containing protein [Brevibacillus reuszeri]
MTITKWSAFESLVERRMEEEKIPGIAIAVAQNGNVLYERGFGYADLHTKEPINPDTVFGCASVTKSFTVMAMLKLAEEGRLKLDDPVHLHLPEFELCGLKASDSVTIQHLMSHTTGLPPLPRRTEINRLNDHLMYIASEEYELLGEPGEYFSYCNDAFLLQGAIIERLTNRLYRRFVTEKILAPLGMHRSTFSLEEIAKMDNVSVPYMKNGQTGEMEAVPWPHLGNYEVGGGLRSTVKDLLRYGSVFVGGDTEQHVVGKQWLEMMWQPVHQVGRNLFYGLALDVVPDYAGVTLVSHGGSLQGVSSHFGFVPEKGLVVAVLMNATSMPAEAIWRAAVNTTLGLPLEHDVSEEPHYEATIEELQKLAGTYQSREGGSLSISIEQGTPILTFADESYLLRASGSDTLVIVKKENPMRFFFKDDELAWAVFFGFRMWTRQK